MNQISLNLPISEFFILKSKTGECLYCNQFTKNSNNFSVEMIGSFYYGMELFANSLSDSFEELVFKGTLVYMIKGENIDCFIKVKKEEANKAKELLPFFKRIVELFENLYMKKSVNIKNIRFEDFQFEIKKMIMRDLSYLFTKEERNNIISNENFEIEKEIYLSSKIIFSLLNNFERVNEHKNGNHESFKSKSNGHKDVIEHNISEKYSKKDKNLLNSNYFDHIMQYS